MTDRGTPEGYSAERVRRRERQIRRDVATGKRRQTGETLVTVSRPAPAPVVAEPTTPMRPSEAMRLGAMTTSQVFGHMGVEGEACALQALYIGYGRVPITPGHPGYAAATLTLPTDPALPVRPMGRAWPTPCPVAGCVRQTGSLIVHLNDAHRWTRPRIADWLEHLGL